MNRRRDGVACLARRARARAAAAAAAARIVVVVVVACVGAVVAVGCDDPVPSPTAGGSATIVSPATRPTTTAPAARDAVPAAAATQPVSAVMLIGDRSTVFPPARLRLESNGQRLVALLFSDDPRDALKDNYTGNSFYLRMELDVDDPDKLADATWRFTAPSAGDREDSPYGIYLGGRKAQLAPFQVLGRFKVAPGGGGGGGGGGGDDAAAGDVGVTATGDSPEARPTSVLLSGQFQLLDDTARHRGPATLVPVAAEMPVKVESDVRPGRSVNRD